MLINRLERINEITRKDDALLSIGADMIVGFPGETDGDHEQSVRLIKDYNITKLHAFPFSAHVSAHSVPAAKLLDQIDQNTKYDRLREIIAAGDSVREKFVQANQ